MNQQESHEILQNFSFKPIDLDPTASSDSSSFYFLCDGSGIVGNSSSEPTSHVIFRDVTTECRSNLNVSNSTTSVSNAVQLPGLAINPSGLLRRANPIRERSMQSFSDADDHQALEESPSRVISPYPFSHTSQEEMEDREKLTTNATALGWSLHGDEENEDDDMNKNSENKAFEVDYSHFFERESVVPIDQEDAVMECDDFSLSTAHSLEDDLSLGGISNDPASFWEEGVTDRAPSPKTHVSLESGENEAT